MGRQETLAMSFDGRIMWLAYFQSGGEREDALYVAGWDMEGDEGSELHGKLLRILENHFVPTGRRLFPPFVSCGITYLDASMDQGTLAVLEGFFASVGIRSQRVRRGRSSPQTLNKRWAEALGDGPLDPNDDEDIGYSTALNVLTKGVDEFSSVNA